MLGTTHMLAAAADGAMKMHLHTWDWVLMVWCLAVTIGVGFFYSRKASASLADYFVSGRSLPWWALGTSMVATTFAADTPLVVTGFVLSAGVGKNWLWWSYLLGGTMTVFIFSRLWRRSGVVTEIELIARRYDGRAANLLRGFKAVYLGLLLNGLICGWVTKAMSQIVHVVFGIDGSVAVVVLIVIAFAYTLVAGLWGVVAADVLQFAMAMVGAFVLAVLSVHSVGGLGALVENSRHAGPNSMNLLNIVPTDRIDFLALFFIPLAFNWWSAYYPGQEPGGGGYVAQRMLAAKDERHARAGTLWFIIAHYVLRPWPWVLVALAAVAVQPNYLLPGAKAAGFDPEQAYPFMFHVLPVGMLGLVIASFVAAYMSTISSMLNLSASYLVNDFYLPFIAKGRLDPKKEVLAGRLGLVLVTAVGIGASLYLASAGEGWQMVIELTAGTGLVLILRWLWWRINAFSEISAMAASAVTYALLQTGPGQRFLIQAFSPAEEAEQLLAAEVVKAKGVAGAMSLPVTVIVATVCWVTVTFLTRPTSREHLLKFYRDIRPGGWWGPVAQEAKLPPTSLKYDVTMWIASSAMVLGGLLGIGSALLLQPVAATAFLALAVAGGTATAIGLRRQKT